MNKFNFTLKGDRSYILGADLYDACWQFLESKYSIKDGMEITASFPRSASRSVEFALVENLHTLKDRQDVVFTLRLKLKVDQSSLFIVGREYGDPIVARENYRDKELTVDYDSKERSVQVISSPLLPVHTIAAAAKLLHLQFFPPPNLKTKWFLTRLNLKQPLDQESVACLKLKYEFLLGQTRTSAELLLKGKNIGAVFCQLREK